MAYREVRGMDIDQVIRRWMAGERIRAIARSTGTDRNTVRRIVRFAEKAGVGNQTPWPDEGKLEAIRQHLGRPGGTAGGGETEQALKPRTEQIRAWLDKDHLLLSKVHELLGRQGLLVSYSSLYRFARQWCAFGTVPKRSNSSTAGACLNCSCPAFSTRRTEHFPQPGLATQAFYFSAYATMFRQSAAVAAAAQAVCIPAPVSTVCSTA